MNRKHFLTALAAAASTALPPTLALSASRRDGPYRLTPAYTAANAPDSASRAILSRPPIRRLTDGGTGSAFAAKMHGQFAQVMEQNFARVDARVAALMLGNLTDQELAHLAQLHVNAAADSGLPSRLTDVLAHRLDGQQLARAAASFGTAPIYESLMRMAPQKLRAFESAALARYPAPVIGAAMAAIPGKAPVMNTVGQFFHYTVYEIYLSFRTAPVGAMGVSGALWETGVVLGKTAIPAFGIGYAVGSGLADLIQTRAPDLWDAIGGTIDTMLENIFGPFSQSPGAAEQDMALAFGLPEPTRDVLAATGGDFLVAEAWQAYAGGGGGGGGSGSGGGPICNDCSLL